ncbi:AAA domain-containing protein [Niallia sp. FSL W8-0635]|uniref:AAA domain-containing protein n=1 Tax=Niallia sp. FSL W8-0635 TaxID=2975337 RepID=UPI0030F89693
MNLYYKALYDDSRKANNMVTAVDDNMRKFERYLTLAIKALREKKHVRAKWDTVEDPTKLIIDPLCYQITLSTSSVLEVFMDENYLELNVENNVPFEPGSGIRLDNNFMPLLPTQFELISISSTRHLLRITDSSAYNGEKQALTSNGSIATITPFEIKDISQNGHHLTLSGKTYNEKKGSYSFEIKGEINEDEDLYINGLYMNQSDWHIANLSGDLYFNEKGERIPILERNGNALYVSQSFPKPKKITHGGIDVHFKIQTIPIPKKIHVNGVEIAIEHNRDSFETLSNVSGLSNDHIYRDPENGIDMFKISKYDQKSSSRKGQLAIRLIDEEEDDESFSKSNVDYFFDQDTEELEGILDGKQVRLKIEKVLPDERILFISRHDRTTLKFSDIPEVLSIRVNTYQLEMQRKAIQKLKRVPLTDQKPLIDLSRRKEREKVWKSFTPETITEWKVLTDHTREGVQAQRSFVSKALATPDFALLEGPPGSGKTTTILELIVQLIQRGKRILLCGSTHVSLDNVLERLQEKNLLDGIFPLRIGKQDSISEKIKEFTMDNYENSKFRDVLIESANLVCGTTFGILKHPLFNLNGDEPPVPKYDYLIIDESSKTTFQEFLIPALFAKRWILVGDIKQLPPFNDREHVNAAIDDDEKLSPALKQACLLIYQYIHDFRVRMPVCLVLQDDVIKNIQSELAVADPDDMKKRVVVIDENPTVDSISFVGISQMDIKKKNPIVWSMQGAEVIFVSEKLYSLVENQIPTNMVVIKDDWENSSNHYQVNAFYSRHPQELHQSLQYTWKSSRKREALAIDFFSEQKKFLKEKTWASEYGWRLVRSFELENVDNSRTRENLKRNLELLSPNTAAAHILKDIETVGDIALPSILQALQDGVGKNRDQSLETTLNSGFNMEEKQNRFVSLDYQHRMHPEISQFPRSYFYNNEALRDSSYTRYKREWTYNRYQNRNIWLDVSGKNKRSTNEAEVQAIMKELREFIKWAATHKNDEHDKGIWEVACITFYNGQRKAMADELKKLTGQKNRLANFSIGNVEIKNYTVDKFQGQEADITFLSMVRTDRIGFMDNPNRLNVAITRARYQRVIVGKYQFFLNNKQSEQLRLLPREATKMTISQKELGE